ncbi:hypothetical protein GPECTOR_34g778 [Gonium pectorale]|uniref:U-box domain-containing protein n=1 Tax=Gonium pectorale TaxID=33097 RepID=A0A150GCR4_GONPE|nr:hypothetical protein GPECTOR_34g778 [Gonium pectorale]|eukprot:KXZ47619.1 hypothetical protein GPECTOR_34g778 [Gonium pectorale]
MPVFLPPEMLVQHGVQDDLMASCVFKPAVRQAPTGAAAASGGSHSSDTGAGSVLLPRWRVWPTLVGRWVVTVAGTLKRHGDLAAAKLRAGAGLVAGSSRLDQAGAQDVGAGAGAASSSRQSRGAGGSGGGQEAQGAEHAAPQHAYVECRLYRTDRASYTCPAVLTVLPSPPRGTAARGHHHAPTAGTAAAAAAVPSNPATAGVPNSGAAAQGTCNQSTPAGACPSHGSAAGAAATAAAPPTNASQPHVGSQPPHAAAAGGHQRRRTARLLRRLWHDLRYMSYGVMMPYKWAPIAAGMLSPHLFLLACLPAIRSLGFMGPYTLRICCYHVLCLVLTGADHLLLLRLATELWLRLRRVRPGAGRGLQRWLVWGRLLLLESFWNGFLASGWGFRAIVMGILTSKQVELWNHLYGPAFQPHPLLSCCLVLPASWLIACAGCGAVWRLTSGQQPTSAPLLMFQEGFLSGLSSPLYSLVYISLAVLGLGGGGVGGGASGILGLAAAGSRLPLWLLDAVVVLPLLLVVALDVLWNMDSAARATPLLLVIVNALRIHSGPGDAQGRAGVAARRARAARGRGLLGGAGAGGDLPERLLARDGGALKHTSLWMLVEQARWWAAQVRDAAEEQRHQLEQRQQRQQQQQQPAALGGGGGEVPLAGDGNAGPAAPEAMGQQQQQAAGALPLGQVARVMLAARHAGMPDVPSRAVAAMMAAMLLPVPEAQWPPRQQEHHARALDLLLAAAATPRGAGGRIRREDDDLDADDGRGGADGGDDELDQDALDVEELLGGGGAAGRRDRGRAGEGGEGGLEGEGERLVRTANGELRPLSALEAELRAGLAQVAALRSQLAAVGRGVADLLLLGRWPPPLQLPPESHGWSEAVPHGFLCPITHSLMTQPALLVSPQLSEASPTYELSAIRQWLQSNRTDPTTGRFLRTYHFIHNDNLRKAIEDWVADRLERERQQQQQQAQQGHALPSGVLRPTSPLPRAQRHGGLRSPTPTRVRRLPQALGAAAASQPAGLGPAGPGRCHVVEGPGPGQRTVCVGTSEAALRVASPERLRGRVPGSRGRSRSRGRALQVGAADGDGGSGGSGGSTLRARQVVQRAVSRQRGLLRDAPPE